MSPRSVILLGATGSIGRQSLDVLRTLPERFRLAGAVSRSDRAGLAAIGTEFPGARTLLVGDDIESLDRFVRETDADIVVNGVAGAAGLVPSLAALETGKDLALANKESVVMAWRLLAAAAAKSGAKILPVDSEHAALFQLKQRIGAASIAELIITASGGAFRDRPLGDLAGVTADEACAHPTWSMGRKITIDSATMANKGLEVIEAVRLFGFAAEQVRVLVHPQSYVHALVRTTDGSLYAQISSPDMRVPIQNALTWPEELVCPWGHLDLAGKRLEFREAESARYPALDLAYRALALGEGATVAYNAADEVAVAAFEAGRIRFIDIAPVIARTLDASWPSRVESLDSIFDIDTQAREVAHRAATETA